jgi:16S rRNA (cytidine1402-2'-O)-methyltransferase
MLYIVPTPIGNLADMTFRAVAVLKEVDLILAEDTRTSGVLLKHYEISKPLQSYHQHNEHQVTERLVSQMREPMLEHPESLTLLFTSSVHASKKIFE